MYEVLGGSGNVAEERSQETSYDYHMVGTS